MSFLWLITHNVWSKKARSVLTAIAIAIGVMAVVALGIVQLRDREHVTILVVTHDPVVAAAADRTIHLRDGRIAGEATEPLRERDPASRSVA